MGPVVPYLSDSPAQLEEAVRQVAAAGAGHVTPIVLHLRPGTREWFLGWLREAHPALLPRYAELYGRGSYAPRQYQERVTGQVRELARKHGVGGRARRQENPRRIMTASASRPATGCSVTPVAAHEQLTLLLPGACRQMGAPGATQLLVLLQ
jgi:DNA repair photolyase